MKEGEISIAYTLHIVVNSRACSRDSPCRAVEMQKKLLMGNGDIMNKPGGGEAVLLAIMLHPSEYTC